MPESVPTSKISPSNFHGYKKKKKVKPKIAMSTIKKGKFASKEKPGTKGPKVKARARKEYGKPGRKPGLPMKGRSQQMVGSMNHADKMLKKMQSSENFY